MFLTFSNLTPVISPDWDIFSFNLEGICLDNILQKWSSL